MSKQPSGTLDKAKARDLTSQNKGHKSLADLGTLDARLRRLADVTLPLSPYILTVPSERPYNVDPRQAHEWKRGTPFDDNEEFLQYLSFLPDWDKGLIVPVGAWDDDRGEAMDRSQSQQSAKSGTSTPNTNAKKVKHSLSDYMRKTTGQSNPRPSKDIKQEESKLTNGGTASQTRKTLPTEAGQKLKRSREDGEVSESEGSQSTKKAKSSPPVKPTARKGPFITLDLPPEISPTLPPALEKELAKLSTLPELEESGRPRAKERASLASDSQTSDKPSKVKSEDLLVKPRTNGVAKAPSGEKGAKPVIHDSINVISHPAPNGAIARPREKAPESRPSKIVKLKIPKSLRTNIARLLKTPQRRPKVSLEGQVGKSLAESKTRDRLSPLPDSSRKDKRPRTDSDLDGRSPPLKRSKHPSLDLSSKPSTPVPAPFRSPTVSQGNSAQKKTATSHPSSERTLGPSAFASDDHASVATPQAPARHGTPSAADAPSSAKQQQRTPLLSSRAREELRETELAFIELGRHCKRSSDRELKSLERARLKTPAWRRGLALGVECTLAFMVSYAVRDELNRAHAPRAEQDLWVSALPWIRRIKELAESVPYLRGLLLQLEAVCQVASWNHAFALASNAATSASAGDDKNGATSASGSSLRSLMKQYNHAMELFAEGAAELPADALQRHFPQTWSAKSNVPLSRASVRFEARVEGDFYLPLSSISTPIEAVRAGRSLLLEWCRKNDVDWTPSIGRPKIRDGASGGSRAAA